MFSSNYFTLLHLAANPLDSFTGEYNSDEEKKAAPYEEDEEVVNENHVEQFMQVSTWRHAVYCDTYHMMCRALQQLLTVYQQHKIILIQVKDSRPLVECGMKCWIQTQTVFIIGTSRTI